MAKNSITIRLQDDLIATLDDEADEKGVSRSEYIREILHSRHEADDLRAEVENLRERLQAREERVTELEEQLRERSRIEEKVDTLARKERESNAPFFVRWYQWWQERE